MPRTKLIITMERDIPNPAGGFTRVRATRMLNLADTRSEWRPVDILDVVDGLESTVDAAAAQPAT